MRLTEYEYFKYSDEVVNQKKAVCLPKQKAEELATILRIVEKRNSIFVISDPEDSTKGYVCHNKTIVKQVGNMFYDKELALRKQLQAYEQTDNEVMLAVRKEILKNEGYLQALKIDGECPNIAHSNFGEILKHQFSKAYSDSSEIS